MVDRYKQGREAEWRVQRELEAEGYTTSRFAGSHGTSDTIAWDTTMTRYIQVKTFRSKKPPSYAEDIAKLTDMALPPNATAELWTRQIGQRGWYDQLVIKHTLQETQ